MLNQYLRDELEKFTLNDKLVDDIIRVCDRKLLTWLTFKMCKKEKGVSIEKTLEQFAVAVGVSKYRIRGAYFLYDSKPIAELERIEGFRTALWVLESEYGYEELWKDLAPYCYVPLRILAAEKLFDKSLKPYVVADMLKVSEVYAFRIRKNYFKHLVDEAGKIEKV